MINFIVFSKIHPGVINDLYSAKRFNHLQVCGTAHHGNLSSVIPGKLNSENPDTAGSPIDKGTLPNLEVCFAEEIQRSR